MKLKNFIRLIVNIENILLDKVKYKKSNYPDISIILTVYNQAHCIHKALRSIQNQSIKNIEIIIIDDCSIDNSTEIIKFFQKEDDRIIFVNHKSNEGKIKARTDGIKIAKGKYITILDGDDSFIHKDILYNSLFIANLANLDVVEFLLLYYVNNKFITVTNNFNINNIIYQPELRTKFFIIKNDKSFRPIISRTITGKIIKNKIMQKVINNIGIKYTKDFILNYEDTIMAVSLYQISQSYYLLKEPGYYYTGEKNNYIAINKNKKCKNNEKLIKDMDEIKFLNFLLEKTENNLLERQVIYHEIISINYYQNFEKSINNHFDLVYNIFDKMIESKFLSRRQILVIKHFKKKLKEKSEIYK